MTAPQKWIPIAVAARELGLGSPAYWRKVEADRRRPPEERRYSAATHAKFPRAVKRGGEWEVWGPSITQHVNRTLRAS